MKRTQCEPGFADSWQVSPANGEAIRSAYSGKLAPEAQAHLFRNSHQAFASRKIARGASVRPLTPAKAALTDFSFRSGDKTYDLIDYVTRNQIVGLIVLKETEIHFEHYERGQTADALWVSMSMAKSVAATLVGCAIADGLIASVHDPIARYVPHLAAGAYEGATIQHILRMSSGASWDDSQTDEDSERRHALELQIAQQSGALSDFMRNRQRVSPPGRRWNYSLADSHMVSELVRAVTGRWLADYMSEKIWAPMGAEADAFWWLDGPDGLEIGGSGICATLRDYARLGLFMMDGGATEAGRAFPDWWLKEAAAPFQIGAELINYGYMWWPVPDSDGGYAEGAFSARGIFGQYIYINPARRIVIAVNSGRSKPLESHVMPDNDFFNALAREL